MTVCDIIINKLPKVLVSEVFSFVNPVWLSCVNKKYLEMNHNHIISCIINHYSMDDYTIYLIRKNKWFCFILFLLPTRFNICIKKYFCKYHIECTYHPKRMVVSHKVFP